MQNKICPQCMSYLLDFVEMPGFKRCPNCDYRCKTEKSMITLKELNIHSYPTTPDIDKNLVVLLERVNKIRTAYNVPMVVTSGLRDTAHQQALIAAGKSNAPKSHHLTGEACDILDEHGKLKEFINNNIKLLEDVGLWCEDFSATPNWVHFQTVPPKSGKRFFIP